VSFTATGISAEKDGMLELAELLLIDAVAGRLIKIQKTIAVQYMPAKSQFFVILMLLQTRGKIKEIEGGKHCLVFHLINRVIHNCQVFSRFGDVFLMLFIITLNSAHYLITY
jgi:hypothetical protein